ncbi:MAG TPA: ASKHA domain-containing protein [Clostridia bacterium]|nr:ASKHA domain-containing protein [Clostridia bacterium]HPQ46011.1 ASKHA domain-containing protein [Clostridia bacterium]
MKIRIIQKDREYIEEGYTDEKLLNVIQRSKASIVAPCGGMKKCGKCLVHLEGCTQPAGSEEIKLIGTENLSKGFRLACFVIPEDGMTARIPDSNAKNKIMTGSGISVTDLKPAIGITKIKAVKPHLDNQVSDLKNIMENTHLMIDRNNLPLLKELTGALENSSHEPTLISYYDKITGVEHKENGHFYGVSIDIGTTTIAVYLYDLTYGTLKGVVSQMNNQKQFGADVISRINYSSTERNGLSTMNKVLIEQLNEMIELACSDYGTEKNDIYMVTLAGNTTMMHFLMGLDPINIGKMPFTPVSTDMHDFPAAQLGLEINKFGHTLCLPSVSAYVGADIVAGLLATGIHIGKEIRLLVDIGTNGEMVLGNEDRMISCSTAAGPAFEGANIRFGTGGISGAIDTVKMVDGDVVFTTIDDMEPIGICGSGIVDAVAVMLENDIIDETGRFYDEDELDLPEKLMERFHELDNMKAFRITDKISVTQKDVREIQNAKAALAAGITTLIKKYGISAGDISEIYLAGGFGNYINISSAIKIGLLPRVPEEKIIASGNTAGVGATMCLLSYDYIDLAERIKRRVEYIELTTDPGFTNEYIDNMIF